MVGSFGDVVFEISDKKVFSINNEINRAYKSKISEHSNIWTRYDKASGKGIN